MIKRFIASMLISCFFFPATAAAEDMNFTLMPTGAVKAEGFIVDDTFEKLKLFSSKVNLTGRTVFLNSWGGLVEESMDVGRFLREHRVRTEIGIPQDNGSVKNGTCQSSCAYIFISGASRKISPGNFLTVHQIRITGKAVSKDTPYTADDLSVVEKVIGDIAVYVSDMGVSMHFIRVTLHHEPWIKQLRVITPAELKEFNIVTE